MYIDITILIYLVLVLSYFDKGSEYINTFFLYIFKKNYCEYLIRVLIAPC